MISSKDKEVLVDIAKRPVLYAKEYSTPSRDNIAGKNEAWRELSIKHKYTENKLRSRWNFLRKKFRNRLRQNFGGYPPNGDVPLDEFEPMRFLIYHIDWDRAERLKRKPSYEQNFAASSSAEYHRHHQQQQHFNEFEEDRKVGEDVQILSSDEDNEDQSSNSQFHTMNHQYSNEDPSTMMLQEYSNDCDSSANNKDDQLFLMSLMPFMTQLSGCQKLRARIRIQQILYEELQKPE
ncbi:hypothetical protein DMENIID0001_056320 [Sergentomyia squamirostris]